MLLTATLVVLEGSTALLASETSRYHRAGEYSADYGGVSFLVMKAGEIVYEDYPKNGGVEKAWETTSGTQSFWSVVAAAMVQDGELGLAEPVVETISEWQSNKMKTWVTVRHLLALTSGLAGRPAGDGCIGTL